jgi:hypothetical protein
METLGGELSLLNVVVVCLFLKKEKESAPRAAQRTAFAFCVLSRCLNHDTQAALSTPIQQA